MATDTIAVVELADFGAAERARSQEVLQQEPQRVRGVGAGRAFEHHNEARSRGPFQGPFDRVGVFGVLVGVRYDMRLLAFRAGLQPG